MFDPRVSVIDQRLAKVKNIFVVSSAKGGVGKSLTASILALILAKKGFTVGLLDLDFTSPATHLILGIKNVYPKEEKGIIPPTIFNIKYMSIIYYSKDHATPLRGKDFTDSLLEILAITKWEKLDFLILDMPPGIGDATLDVIRFIRRAKFLIVATPSLLTLSTVMKMIELLKKTSVPIVGIIENMKTDKVETIRKQMKEEGIDFLGNIDFDSNIEESIGNIDKLLETNFSRQLEKIISKKFW